MCSVHFDRFSGGLTQQGIEYGQQVDCRSSTPSELAGPSHVYYSCAPYYLSPPHEKKGAVVTLPGNHAGVGM